MIQLRDSPEINAALSKVKTYALTFSGHPDGMINNGAHYIVADDGRTAEFAVKLCAELLERHGWIPSSEEGNG